jgi:hypothetical protein
VTAKRGVNRSRENGTIFSTLEGIKSRLDGIVPFLMDGLEMRTAAANSTAFAQGQHNEMQGTIRKHKRHRGKDESPSRSAPHKTEHDSGLPCD